ncbi:MAG: serine hydrolase domain-containing protein [Phaeodactylibacter sp.]|uniref:serine hydrolase domain-containing protein n=1 Tax=Phaeodactylibacter sp. TaxID=1940289 RepID=UPI0032ECE0A5
MKHMHSHFLLLTFLITLPTLISGQALQQVVPESVGISSGRLAHLDRTFQDYVDNGQLPGAVVLVARNGQVPYFKAFGQRDMETGESMPKDAIFRIASQTKAIVSVGVMMLQEEGRLLIGDPVGKYLPEYMETTVAVAKEEGGYEVVKAERPITIRDLLTHTAGIGYGYGPAKEAWEAAGIQGWYFADREEPVRETIRRMAGLPFDAQPGERFVYGYNTDILGVLIEVVSGQPLDAFLTTRIFEPLGMEDTHFYLPEEKVSRLATVYSKEADNLERAPTPGHMRGQGHYVEGPRTSFSGGAGLLSTAMDYARFLQMMFNGGTYNGQRILSRKSVDLMTVDHMRDIPYGRDGQGFGLGFTVATDLGARGTLGSVGDYGWGGAYHSHYWVDPVEELVVVYFTQVIPARGLDDHAKLRALVYQALE